MLRSIVKELWFKVLVAMVLGMAAGAILHEYQSNQEYTGYLIKWVAMPGHLFLKLIQMIMIPLMVSSIIYGVGSMSISDLRNTGGWVALYFVVTSIIAILIGIAISFIIKPWSYSAQLASQLTSMVAGKPDPTNNSFANPEQYLNYLIPSNIFVALMNGDMFPLVVFSVIVGVAVSYIKSSEAAVFLKVIFAVQDIMLTITKWAMYLAPIAVFGLMCFLVAGTGIGILFSLGMYVLTVILGLLCMCGVYFVIVQILSGKSFVQFISDIKEVILLAFSVASSAPTLPLSMKVAEEKLKAPPALVKFILPVGATMSMDGTALYQTIAALFIAHIYSVELTLPQIILLCASITMASIGTPSAPGAGIMVLGAILTTVGIPIEGISLIIGVDRILGMARAGANVISDLSAVVLFSSRQTIKSPPN